MKQAGYAGAGRIELRDGAATGPASGQVTVEVAFTGICGTDLHIFHGDMDARVAPGSVLGHEMSGRIAALGPDVTGWAVGDPVTVMPLDWCGECPACARGNEHVCQNLTFIGIDAPGAMQQRWNVPARTLLRLPDGMSLRDAALVEPTAVAVHDVRRAGVAPGDRVLVVGAGPVGTLVALVAREHGAEVYVVETDRYRRDVASGLGLDVADPAEAGVPAHIDAWTGGAGADIAFEVSGSAAGLASAVANLAVRGRLCMVAIHTRKPEIDMHRIFWRELTVIGARLYDRSDFERAVQLIAAGTIPAETLVSAVYPLDRAEDAFTALASGGEVMKVLVDCRAGD